MMISISRLRWRFLFDKIRETNRALDQGTLTPTEARGWLDWWKRIDSVLA